jgi:hypothetical protein
MRVVCLTNRGEGLPPSYLDPIGGYDKATIFPLEPRKEYAVYALTLRRGGVWYYIVDDRLLDYPVWHPAPLFKVEDPRVSRYWVFAFHGQGIRDGDAVFAFREWAEDPLSFYDRLSDGDSDAVAVFRRYRELMDIEFSNRGEQPVAESLDDGWLLCPACREAWRTTAVGTLVRCPNCSVLLRNPAMGLR